MMAILDLKTKIHACRWCIFWSSKGVFEHYKKDFSEPYKKDFSDKYARVRQMRNHPMQGVFFYSIKKTFRSSTRARVIPHLKCETGFCEQYDNRLFCYVDKMQFFKHDK
ncbi:Uncharacterised protein [Moraxella lacunata]|uniref:Uncharacterized protein n=1 Tax=Moraxella lacunata TaxID=477 RepID=A0A378QET5_MORLA|nr:Uncharacterised protein [Moraxella lacunata]